MPPDPPNRNWQGGLPPCDDPAKAAAAAEDIALMLRVKNGDDAAFAELVRRHQKSIMNFFVRSGVTMDVEDMAQDTFVKVYKVRRTYQPTAKFTTFLYLVARRTMIDAIRKQTRKHTFLENFKEETPQTQQAPATRGEQSDAEAALACLSPQLRETVVLVIMQGLPYHEAADILGIPLGTVKSRISSALERMRQFMSNDHEKK